MRRGETFPSGDHDETMDFLILGDGAEERAWAEAIAGRGGHRLVAAYPGFAGWPEVPAPRDFDDAIATAGVEAVVVGGGLEVRGEWLRRAAAEGLPTICLHPPGDDSEPYYQVALSRDETGAVIVPDLPLRLHPGGAALRRALQAEELGPFRGLRHEAPAVSRDGDLVRHAFPRMVDVVRALLGEIAALTATGDPPGDRPDESLVVQLRGPQSRRAEVRLGTDPGEPSRLVVVGAEGSLALEYDPDLALPARLVHRPASGPERVEELGPWDPHAAILDVLARALDHRDAPIHPDLLDGTRAMELAEAVARSLRRGRTVDLHYEEISEEASFKGVMTSLGCAVLLGILVVLPAALMGPAMGIPWTIYLAWAIPPLLVGFILLQTLRFAIKDRVGSGEWRVGREDEGN